MFNPIEDSSTAPIQIETTDEEEKRVSVTLNGITFHSNNDAEHFYTDDPEQPLTVVKILLTAYPNEYRSHARRLEEVPPPLLLLSTSSRIRIIRAAQLHHIKIPSDGAASEVQALLDSMAFLHKGNRNSFSQYNHVRWALNYADDQRAASAILRLGFIHHNTTGPPAELPSFHKAEQYPDGIHLEIAQPYSLQDCVTNACLSVLNQYLQDRRRGIQQQWSSYFQVGCIALYRFNGWFLSLTPHYAEVAKGCVQSYISELLENKLRRSDDEFGEIPIPSVEEPEEWVPDQSHIIPWSDFQFTSGATEAKMAHNKAIAVQKSIEALTQKLVPAGFLPGRPYRRCELLEHLGGQQITRAERNGLITKGPKRGEFYLTFLEDIYNPQDDNPEFESEEE